MSNGQHIVAVRSLDFFFSHASTYSYLSVMRAGELARAAGVTLRWRPFRVRVLMEEQNNRPFVGKPVKMKYMWRDLERRAAQHGIPFNGIPPYPVDAEALANRVATVAAMQGWAEECSVALYRKWFLEHKDPGKPDSVHEVLAGLGKDVDAIMARADSAEIQARLTAEVDAARALGIFGSPTFVVGNEIFWGDDRLEIALQWCKAPLA